MLSAFPHDPPTSPSRQTQRYGRRSEHKVRDDICREVGVNLCPYPSDTTTRLEPLRKRCRELIVKRRKFGKNFMAHLAYIHSWRIL